MTTVEQSPSMMSPAPDVSQVCPICQLPRLSRRRRHELYGVNVCRKCTYRMANRRQGAFLADYILLSIVQFIVSAMVTAAAFMAPQPPNPAAPFIIPLGVQIALALVTLSLLVLFAARDGWRGRSPGKWLAGLQVVREDTFEPIDLKLSVKRNLPVVAPLMLFGLPGLLDDVVLPLLGGVASLIYLLIISQRLVRGPRWGDKWAGTRVIWLRYAHRAPFDPRGRYCVHCAYDLTGNLSGVCPECGTHIAPLGLNGRHCRKCGYDLHGNVSGVCPECGTPAARMASDDSPLVREGASDHAG